MSERAAAKRRATMYDDAEALYETWVNGNRTDCVDACMGNVALAVLIADAMDTQDRGELVGIIVSRKADELTEEE